MAVWWGLIGSIWRLFPEDAALSEQPWHLSTGPLLETKKSQCKKINGSRDLVIMEVLGFCFTVTDGQCALKLNLALIALWCFIIDLLHRFCLQVYGGLEMCVCSPSLSSTSPLCSLHPAARACVCVCERGGQILFHPPLRQDKGHCNSLRVWCSLP